MPDHLIFLQSIMQRELTIEAIDVVLSDLGLIDIETI